MRRQIYEINYLSSKKRTYTWKKPRQNVVADYCHRMFGCPRFEWLPPIWVATPDLSGYPHFQSLPPITKNFTICNFITMSSTVRISLFLRTHWTFVTGRGECCQTTMIVCFMIEQQKIRRERQLWRMRHSSNKWVILIWIRYGDRHILTFRFFNTHEISSRYGSQTQWCIWSMSRYGT